MEYNRLFLINFKIKNNEKILKFITTYHPHWVYC